MQIQHKGRKPLVFAFCVGCRVIKLYIQIMEIHRSNKENTTRHPNRTVLLAVLTLLSGIGNAAVFGTESSQEEADRTGTLELKELIARVVLLDGDGNKKVIKNRGLATELPVGTYTLSKIYLKGGYQGGNEKGLKIEIEPGESTKLEAGPPLEQVVDVKRVGRMLQLDYKLVGAAGNRYSQMVVGDEPEFMIYKDGEKIAGGKFEYG